jgi:hypothetical protein
MLPPPQKALFPGRGGVTLIWVRKFGDNGGEALKIPRQAVLGE